MEFNLILVSNPLYSYHLIEYNSNDMTAKFLHAPSILFWHISWILGIVLPFNHGIIVLLINPWCHALQQKQCEHCVCTFLIFRLPQVPKVIIHCLPRLILIGNSYTKSLVYITNNMELSSYHFVLWLCCMTACHYELAVDSMVSWLLKNGINAWHLCQSSLPK